MTGIDIPSRSAAALLALLLVAACGGRTGSRLDAAVDGGQPDSTSGDQGVGAVQGLVYLYENRRVAAGAQQGFAWAFFSPSPLPFFNPLKDLGSGCALYANDFEGKVQYSAGKIEVTGGQYPVTLEPDPKAKPDEWLYWGIMVPDLFASGTSLKVVAKGDTLAGFSDTLRGVGNLDVKIPPGPARRTAPLTITFPRTGEPVWVTLNGETGGELDGRVRCAVDGSRGTFTVPATALQALPAKASFVELGAGWVNEKIVTASPRVKVHLVAFHVGTERLALVK
jgi:hypothetical protein